MKRISTTLFRIAALLALVAIPASLKADDGAWSVRTEGVATIATGDNAPFWLTANRHGLSTAEPASGYLRAGIFKSYTRTKGFDYALGADLAAAYHHAAPVRLQQCYADVRYGCWQLSVGSKERGPQGKNAALSSGGLLLSGNATPIPQVRFGIEDYTEVPFWFHGWAHVKGFLSYGTYTDGRWQQSFVGSHVGGRYTLHTLLHEKAAFLKIAKPSVTPFALELGLEMDSQFGGDCYEIQPDGTALLWLANPHGAKDFAKALIPMAGGDDAAASDQQNIAGNQIGSWHAAVSYQGTEWSVRAYAEHLFEDKSGMIPFGRPIGADGRHHLMLVYPWRDGLLGAEATLPRNPFVSHVVAEYVTTVDQGGALHHMRTDGVPYSVGGADNYYYHSSFQSWHHGGMAMGTPFALSPIYNADGNLYMMHTRLRAFHLGFDGQPAATLAYRVKASAFRSLGTYIDPVATQRQFSALGELTWMPAQFSGWQGTLSLAFDRGDLTGHSVGSMLSVQKIFRLP